MNTAIILWGLFSTLGLLVLLIYFIKGEKSSEIPLSLQAKIDLIIQNQNKLMGAFEDMEATLEEINVSTNNIAADIVKLTNSIKPGLTQAQADTIKGRLTTISDQLKAIAAQTPEDEEPPITE